MPKSAHLRDLFFGALEKYRRYETDLARLELWKGMMGQEFWEAYKAIYPVDPLYEQRWPIYQLLWCFECAWPTAAHLADTQSICAELGLPHFEGFEVWQETISNQGA